MPHMFVLLPDYSELNLATGDRCVGEGRGHVNRCQQRPASENHPRGHPGGTCLQSGRRRTPTGKVIVCVVVAVVAVVVAVVVVLAERSW